MENELYRIVVVTRKIARRSGGGTTAKRRSTTQKSLETELVQSKQRVGDKRFIIFLLFLFVERVHLKKWCWYDRGAKIHQAERRLREGSGSMPRCMLARDSKIGRDGRGFGFYGKATCMVFSPPLKYS
ncbi:hypothetical protein YC2023_021095 [Brassica napus]